MAAATPTGTWAMNAFKHLLKRGGSQPPLGTWLLSASPLLAEAAGHAGFEWGVIDLQHAPLDLRDVLQLLQALAATRMLPVVRVPGKDMPTINRLLDAGATTLLLPLVQNAAEAAQAVAATRYPPQGVRGMAGAADISRAAHYGIRGDYLRTADHDMAVIVQIDTVSALAQLEGIAAVDGVDGIFIGPAALAASMGLPGHGTHPRVMTAMVDAAARCHALGKPIGTIGIEPEAVAQYRAAGYNFLAVNSDLGLFMQAARRSIQALRARESEHVHDLSAGTHQVP